MVTKVKNKKSTSVDLPRARRGRTRTSVISKKNQVTIPVDVLRAAGLENGDSVEFDVVDGRIEIAIPRRKIWNLVGTSQGLFDNFDLDQERSASWGE